MATMLNITGMTCNHCVGAVTKALQAVPGVEKAAVNLESGTARVEGKASPDALIRAVEKEGYKARVAGSQ